MSYPRGQSSSTGPSVRVGVRNRPLVDGRPWKLVGTNSPSGKVSLLASSVKQLVLLVAVATDKKVAPILGPRRVPCYLLRLAGGRTWPLLPHIPHSLLHAATMKANLGLTLCERVTYSTDRRGANSQEEKEDCFQRH